MSINKRHVPSLKMIKEQYNNIGHNSFIRYWAKVEVFIGSSEGIDFIYSKIEEGLLAEEKQ
tara:strand:+ start:17293 stop:17475 length:183 start_codon:yes stop_codon:yes gene_type:complete